MRYRSRWCRSRRVPRARWGSSMTTSRHWWHRSVRGVSVPGAASASCEGRCDMDLLGTTLKAVDKAFAITQQFQAQVEFQLQIVWNLDPVNDTISPVPTFTKTVLAVVYKPKQARI